MTVDRAARVLDALQAEVRMTVELPAESCSASNGSLSRGP